MVSGYPILYLEKGPFYLLNSLWIALVLFIVVGLYVKEYYKAGSIRHKRYGLLSILSILPIVGLFLILLDVGGLGIDFVALFIPISLFLLFLALFQYDFLALKTLARETLFENSADALLLMDEKKRLIDNNRMANYVMHSISAPQDGEGDPEDTLLTLLQRHDKGDLEISTENGLKYYEVKRVDLKDKFQHRVGSLFQLGDRTERKEAEEALRISEEKYRLLTEKMLDVLWVLDLHTERIRYVSPSVFGLCGYRVQEMLGERLKEQLTSASYQQFIGSMAKRIEEYNRGVDDDYTDEVEQVCRDGQVIIVEVKGRLIHNQLTGHLEYMGVSRDITEKKLVQERLKELATTDSLTGLYNRRHFLELVQQEFQQSHDDGEVFSLLMMDIDHFKKINDTYGHAAGDMVLEALGMKLESFFGSSAIKGRLGGEEFAVLLLDTSLDKGYSLAEDFRETIETSTLLFEGEEITYTLSIGVAAYDRRLKDYNALLKVADKGLYEAKEGGRDRTIRKEVE